MKNRKIYSGDNLVRDSENPVSGNFVTIGDEKFYKIENCNRMPDFFMTLVSDSDHWMFISSNGSLTAGRRNRDNALFPYYSDDKIHDSWSITGNRTIALVEKPGRTFLWEPFSKNKAGIYNVQRNIYKSIYGNKIRFEEVNFDLGISFLYGWSFSERYGFVKESVVSNTGGGILKIDILDGITNILPSGIGYAFQNEYSNLLDAYKKSERIEGTSLGLFLLSSIPVDRAEPSEALVTTTVWTTGYDTGSRILISEKQLPDFFSGKETVSENDIRASRGAYFLQKHIDLEYGNDKSWLTIAEINQDSTDVANLIQYILEHNDLTEKVMVDVERGTENLKKMASSADGFQLTNTDMCYARHYSNTLYNIMRGGIFRNGYRIETRDFRQYVAQINRLIEKEMEQVTLQFPESLSYMELIRKVKETGNDDFLRIAYEYLPLVFSRRHGDPSRPWNIFSIETKNEDGSVKYNYEGNWRDIFQNWEALCVAYPEFVEGIISKFVNASTIDGYNPYRITRKGIDWECPDPDDPWAYIGYWGDHQVIYLQKLLELSDHYHPGRLDDLLASEIFTYANVPYRIKPYSDIIRDPKNTITFDEELNRRIENEVGHLGADAKLLKRKGSEEAYKVNLTEKVLAMLLSKLSNFIPGAGIWLNTQRPEWNDANNALVGNGVSMVTLCYLRRSLKFWEEKFSRVLTRKISISEELADLFRNIYQFLDMERPTLGNGFTDADRKRFADFLGQAHSKYRTEVYNYTFSGEKKPVAVSELLAFTRICLEYADRTIRDNRRDDGLYHAYNLISISDSKISIRYLYEMLEGQVAVLSSGLLAPAEALEVLDALKASKMFRPDQYSYMLYPDRQLPRFTQKNNIPEPAIRKSPLLSKLLEENNTDIVKRDENGKSHFNGTFRNAGDLEKALDSLRVGHYSHLVETEKEQVLDIYEKIFDHQSFTGRSGTFYGYEGLGSIYWHMVSKLLLAVQECYYNARAAASDPGLLSRLKDHYYEIKAGIGIYKSPDLYGAFPMDAYSHTPANAGVKQPGLTGQVKEDVISRLGETGIRVREGQIVFDTSLANHEEILTRERDFEYFGIDGSWKRLSLHPGQWVATFCQVPVIFMRMGKQGGRVSFTDGKQEEIIGNALDRELSAKIFCRTGEVSRIDVSF